MVNIFIEIIARAEEICFNNKKSQRANLSLIVNEGGVIFYKIDRENTNEKKYLKFIQEFYDNVKNSKIKEIKNLL